jgi:hypothetical protein
MCPLWYLVGPKNVVKMIKALENGRHATVAIIT